MTDQNQDVGFQQRRGFFKALVIQRRIVSALMIREALSRFGHENLGFFWIMGEPLVLTVGVMILWTITGGTHGHSVGIIPFVLTGYSMLTLWRHCVSRSMHSLRQNVGLLFHRNIRSLDILISRICLECLGGLAAFTIAYIPFWLLGYIDTIYDPLLFVGGWMLMTWFGFGFGLMLAGITELSEAAERFVAPVMYVTLPLTGGFYMVNWLPDSLQNVVLWSPLVNAMEMYRAGLLGPSVEAKWNTPYLILCCIIVTTIGLPLVREAQKHVRME